MKPKGFWSYARSDDDHLGSSLSNLRREIAAEVSMLMGKEVSIFQDILDLRTGDRWAEKLRAEVSAASFLIPVLTPSFFNRAWCREEVLTYLRICEEVGLEPRIFPIRLVEWDEEEGCEVRKALQPFQYKDFTNWRFESDQTRRNRLLNDFAKDVKERLKLLPAPRVPQKVAADLVPTAQAGQSSEEIDATRKVDTPPPKQTVHLVDPWPKRGDFISIQAAIDAAEPGDRIVVREGSYRESLRLSKVLEIIGEGDRERIVVVTDEGDALHCDAPLARIAGLRFRREAGGEGYGVRITGGRAVIEDCVVESEALACVAINGIDAAPMLQRCVLQNGNQNGLFVFGGAEPLVEDCQFIGNGFAGASVKGQGTYATLRRCVALRGKQGGFFFHNGAGGLLEDCEATGNGYSGVHISTGATPVLRDCTLRQNSRSGVVAYDAGRGRVEGGRIEGNAAAGVQVQDGSDVFVTGCTITNNAFVGIKLADAASSGTFRDNDLRGNRLLGAWSIVTGAQVERHGNIE